MDDVEAVFEGVFVLDEVPVGVSVCEGVPERDGV